MIRNVLIVKSSDGSTSYSVEFEWDGKRLMVSCDCRAGVRGQHCRHKDGLINGDHTLLSNSSDRLILDEVMGWVRLSPVAPALSQLKVAEENLMEAQVAVKAAKKSLESAMRPT